MFTVEILSWNVAFLTKIQILNVKTVAVEKSCLYYECKDISPHWIDVWHIFALTYCTPVTQIAIPSSLLTLIYCYYLQWQAYEIVCISSVMIYD